MAIIGISGKARAGKDTLFAIAEKDGYVRLSFADALKDRAMKDLGLTREHVHGSLKETPSPLLNGHSPREFLIELGNLYRKYRPNFWVDQVIQYLNNYPNCMITDVRYENEAEAIKAAGGKLIRLERHPERDHMVDDKTKQSISETALDNYQGFDYVLLGFANRVPADLEGFWSQVAGKLEYSK